MIYWLLTGVRSLRRRQRRTVFRGKWTNAKSVLLFARDKGCQSQRSTMRILLIKQEGWLSVILTERASVSAISLRHILACPGYAPGTITVNVAWMKRGFNACQTHRSMYPSIFNRFPVPLPRLYTRERSPIRILTRLARRRVTSLVCATPLPLISLNQTATKYALAIILPM